MGRDGGTEFATALRGLKERTPHSFETLAARTGISRSALHRYCSAKSVPADFATVERFAKRCGAERDELVRLHRLWVRATDPDAPPEQDRVGRQSRMPAAGPKSEPEVVGSGGRLRRPGWRRGLIGAVAAVAVGAALLVTLRGAAGTDGQLLLSDACREAVGMGQRGECVREVQRLLAEAGADADRHGRFVADTRREVLAFQALTGVHINGVVDQATKRALYKGEASLATWDKKRVTDRIREVFTEEPDKAVRMADCQSMLDPHYVMSNSDSTRTWGVFQLSESRLRALDATPSDALDPEWNIQAAHRLWSKHEDFSAWPRCRVSLDTVAKL